MQPNSRRSDLDWLRVLATFTLFLFHVNKTFDVEPFFHIKNDVLTRALDPISLAIHFWHMPLFFLLAGWSTFTSLTSRGAEQFMKRRVRRLLLPFLAAIVLLCPFLKYFELRSGFSMGLYGYAELEAPLTQSFFEFWPSFWTPANFTWSHLWFVIYLFVFTLVYRRRLLRMIDQPGRFAEVSTAGLYRPLLLLCGIQMTLRLIWPGGQNLVNDWANFAYYSTYFFLGFILALCPAWQDVVDREAKRAGLTSLASMGILFAFWWAKDGKVWPEEPELGAVMALIPVLGLTAVAGYGTIVWMLGFAHRHLDRGGPALTYLSEASMPIYILHQVGIVIPGFYILQTSLGVGAKYATVLLVAIVSTLSVYHFVVRPSTWLRPLFGLEDGHEPMPRLAPAARLAALLIIAGFVLPCTVLAKTTLANTMLANTMQANTAAGEMAPSTTAPLGTWYAEGGMAKVEVTACEEELCGTVVWLSHPLDENGCELTDRHNDDPELRSRPVVGLQLLSGHRQDPDDPNQWTGGTIYDPGSGRTYRASIHVRDKHRLDVRGYVLHPMLGRTSAWFRVGFEEEVCLAKAASG